MPRKKKVEAPIITCADCIHEYACCAWTLGGRLATQNAERCPYFDTVRSSAAYLIGKLEANEWISVKDRMPTESDGTVLVCFPDVQPYNLMEHYVNAKHDERVQTAHYSQYNDRWYIGDMAGVSDIRPTHWMPLPEAAKED